MRFIKKYKRKILVIVSELLRKRSIFFKFIKNLFLLLEFPFEILGDVLFFGKRITKKGFIEPKKILIARIDQFGDVLFSTFLLPIIKKRFPSCQIDYLVNPKTKGVLKNNPYIQNVYEWDEVALRFIVGRKESDTKSISTAVKANQEIVKKLRRENYDYIINGRAFIPSSNIWWKFIKPKCLIAFDISEQSFFADYWAEYNLKDEEWENYMNLLLPLGIKKDEFFYEPIFNNFDDSVFDYEQFKTLKEKKYIVCAPVSFDRDRQWGVENWREVISRCCEGGIVVLTGTPLQREYLESLIKGLNSGNSVIATNLSLPELGSIYRNAKLFLGIESFPAHLALALKKPIICLMRNDAYYLKGFSSMKTASARSMISLLEGRVFTLNIKTTSVEKVVKIVKSLS